MADETKTNATPEAPGGPPPPAPEQTEQAVIPGMDGGPAPSGKVIDLSDVRAEAGKTGPEAPAPGDAPPEQGAAGSVTEYTKQEWEQPLEEIKAEQKKPRRGRPPKTDRAAPEAGEKKPGRGRTPKAKADKAPGKGKRAAPGKGAPPAPAKEEAPAPPPEPAQPRDATRSEKEEIVYLNLSDLHPFKDHPFGVRDDAEMQGLVESVRSGGVNQPALVRPREDGGYEIRVDRSPPTEHKKGGFSDMKRPLAYVTAAWRGDPCEITEQAAKYCRAVYDAGFSPICPTLYLPLFLNDAVPEEHKSGIDMGRDLLRRSRVLVVCGGPVTEEMKNDIATAQRLGITATTLEGILTVKGQGHRRR